MRKILFYVIMTLLWAMTVSGQSYQKLPLVENKNIIMDASGEPEAPNDVRRYFFQADAVGWNYARQHDSLQLSSVDSTGSLSVFKGVLSNPQNPILLVYVDKMLGLPGGFHVVTDSYFYVYNDNYLCWYVEFRNAMFRYGLHLSIDEHSRLNCMVYTDQANEEYGWAPYSLSEFYFDPMKSLYPNFAFLEVQMGYR